MFVIENAVAVKARGKSRVNVVVDGEKIASVETATPKGGAAKRRFSAAKTVDARGLLLLPGAVDVHVHFRSFKEKRKGDWKTESRAALHGGVTTVLDMPNNARPLDSLARVRRKRALAKRLSHVDFGLYAIVSRESLPRLRALARECVAFKLYMWSVPTGKAGERFLERAFKAVARTGKLLVVHAEDSNVLAAVGCADAESLAEHDCCRPALAEAAGVARALHLSKKHGTRLHVTHVSAAESVMLLRKARKTNRRVSADACLPHLFFDWEHLRKNDARFKQFPPLRLSADREALWRGLKSGTIDCIATDHAPHLLREKKRFAGAPGGMPTLDYFYPALLTECRRRRIPFTRLTKWVAEKPAALFGLEGKGRIAAGFAADLVLVERISKTVRAGSGFSKPGWTAFDGKKLNYVVRKVFQRGREAFDGKGFSRVPGRNCVEFR